MRKVSGVVALILILSILFIGPWVTGIYLERLYPSIFKAYDAHGFHVEVKSYERGWFTSHATIVLEVKEPDYAKILTAWHVPTTFTIKENIQHGPIFYRPLNGFSSIFGFATIHHLFPNDLVELNDYVSFRGEDYNKLIIHHMNIRYPGTPIHIQMNRMESHLWISSNQSRIEGKLSFHGIKLFDNIATIAMPEVMLTFNQHDPHYYYLLGQNTLLIPEVLWSEVDGKSLTITDLRLSGFTESSSGTFEGNRKLEFKKIVLGDHVIGPLHFELTAKKLNAKAILDIFQAYRTIQERGELYQSQLKQNIMTLLPNIVNVGTLIQVNELNVETPEGKLVLEGKLNWLKDTMPEDVYELLQTADANMDLSISKKLLEQWIASASTMPFFNQANQELRNAYIDAREEMDDAMRLNAFLITDMTNNRLLLEEDALGLLLLQKNTVTLDEYRNQLTKLFLNRSISRETDYRLFLQYLEVQRPLLVLLQTVQKQKEETLQGMRAQWNDWIKQGYIKENKDDYIITMKQADGSLKVNNKAVN
jgi:uncharacterized protein YdgA (DUF945 family)